ncbi:S-layer family protein [Nostoc linckia FACHB-104]|nr:S-layer family protein [Nostoc linckia FACHB-104]
MPEIQNFLQKFFIPSVFVLVSTPAKAQIIPDNTLGAEASSITPNTLINGTNADLINGGAQRGGNLFHSFTEFNINDRQRVYFGNPSGVQNILTRVTGGNASNILGTLGVNGIANLFLINPNGIVFGNNASLDIRGSFLATTANALQFGNQGIFSTTNPQAPPLLTVNPSALLFNQINQNNPGKIQVQGNGQGLRLTSDLIDTENGLRVAPDKSLALVGGDISLEGATLKTAGGRIDLGSVSGEGLVSLAPIDKGFSLAYDGVKNFGNIQLSQQTSVDVSGEGAGDVQVVGKRISITDISQIQATTLGNQPGGSLVVKGSEAVELTGYSTLSEGLRLYSGLFADVYPNATGNGGELIVNTPSLLVQDGAKLVSRTFGTGNAGNVTVNVDSLLVSGGAQFGTGTFSAGNSGNLIVNATKDIQVIGTTTDTSLSSGLFVQATPNSTGTSGNLTVNTGSLLVRDGAEISANNFGSGDSGNLIINAPKEMQVIGAIRISSNEEYSSNISTRNDKRTAGNLTINTGSLFVADGAQIRADTYGAGKAGNLTINANNGVQLIGTTTDGTYGSGLYAQANRGSIGAGGSLTINTTRLLVKDGAEVGAGTFGVGNGGDLTINASEGILVSGVGANNIYSSDLNVAASEEALGAAGNLTINTTELIIQNGGFVSSSTSGQGNAGNLTVNASQRLVVKGINVFPSALLSAAVGSIGTAADITINTGDLIVEDGAGISVRSLGQGNAGNLNINANSIRLNNQATINANTRSVNINPNKEQATINLNSKDIILRRGSDITANATGENVIGGNININTDILAAVQNSDISANSTDFRGGRVKITAQGIFGTQPRNSVTPESDITATGANPDLIGNTEVNTPDVDPTKRLTELPTEVIDASTKFSQICPTDPNPKPLGKFIVTGRGNLPPSPLEWMTGTSIHIPLATLEEQTATSIDGVVAISNNGSPEIIEAQGWIKTATGEIAMVTNTPQATPTSRLGAVVCPVSREN